jgi:glycosyltransferase involved in cell wall biosynthesis
MRILLNAVSARAGGGVSYLTNLLKYLPGMAPDCHFLAAVPAIDFAEKITDQKNLELLVVKEASQNTLKRFYWENTGLIKLCKDWQADLLFCVANIVPLIKPDIPVVVMVQNIAPLTPGVLKRLWKYEPATKALQMLVLKFLTLFALRHADCVIALSQATRRLLQHHNKGSSIKVLYHGISGLFNADAPKPAKAPTTPYFIYVSNLYVYKGLEYMVEALAHDPDLPPVYIAGQHFDQGYLQWINKLADDAGVSKRLIFLKHVAYSELPGWYSHARAMVYTSWCENCPNILLEAMACGCPVVAMKIGPMPEICEKGGIYAQPFAGKDLARAMRQALHLTASQKAAAQKRAAEFTWKKAMQAHKEIFYSFKS